MTAWRAFMGGPKSSVPGTASVRFGTHDSALSTLSRGGGTTHTHSPSKTARAARAYRTGAYVPAHARAAGKAHRLTAEASTETICAAPWIAPTCAGPNSGRQTPKNTT